MSVKQVPSQKHLGMVLDNRLNFQERLKNTLDKVDKTIGLLYKLQNILPPGPPLAVYKSFIRPHLEYSDVFYDQHYYNSFHQKLESIQYNVPLAIEVFSLVPLGKTLSRIRFRILSTTVMV